MGVFLLAFGPPTYPIFPIYTPLLYGERHTIDNKDLSRLFFCVPLLSAFVIDLRVYDYDLAQRAWTGLAGKGCGTFITVKMYDMIVLLYCVSRQPASTCDLSSDELQRSRVPIRQFGDF